MTEEEIRNRGIRCALRHMDSLRIQAAEERIANFAEACINCPEMESCRYDWLSTTDMIAKETEYRINLMKKSIERRGRTMQEVNQIRFDPRFRKKWTVDIQKQPNGQKAIMQIRKLSVQEKIIQKMVSIIAYMTFRREKKAYKNPVSRDSTKRNVECFLEQSIKDGMKEVFGENTVVNAARVGMTTILSMEYMELKRKLSEMITES